VDQTDEMDQTVLALPDHFPQLDLNIIWRASEASKKRSGLKNGNWRYVE